MNSESGNFQPDQTDVTISERGRVLRYVILGQPVFLTITNPRGAIQNEHRQGRFHEPEELQIIRQYFVPGSVFCDIEANNGNHSLFALKFLHASRAILFEPNPMAIAILRSNLNMNALTERCDLSHLGLGVSDATADGMGVVAPSDYLCGGRMVEGEGALQVRRGDDLLAETTIDCIKIDVEGMNMRVLDGLSAAIAARQPVIFVEVDRLNAEAFAAWVLANDYDVRAGFHRYPANENFQIIPEPLCRSRAKA